MEKPLSRIFVVKLTFFSQAMFTRVNHDLGARIKTATEGSIKAMDDTARAKSTSVMKVDAAKEVNGFANGKAYSHNAGMFAHIHGDDGLYSKFA